MKKISILLVCVLLLTAVGCGSQKGSEKENTAESSSVNKGYYTLNVKINPDVSFLVDGKQVVGVVTNNDDARDVYNNIDFSSYDVDVVVNEWAAQCEKMGFNTHKMEVGICGSEEDIISFSDTWDQLKEDYQVSDAGDIQSIEEQAEMPVCEFCGKQLFDVYDLCPDCGHEVGYEVVVCFCGAKMATASRPCPVCHLHNLTGEYDEGWGPEGKEFLYCFCGSTCDIKSGICDVCHLNNITGAYEDGYTNPNFDPATCFCGESFIDPVTGVCPVCHLNNITGAYEDGYGNQESEEISDGDNTDNSESEEGLCFCGKGIMDPATGICPVCHLNNYTGAYEDGYSNPGSAPGTCFCGEGIIDPVTGVCPVCHLNNFTAEYEEGYGTQEVLRCFCGSADVDWGTGICRTCHLNNMTGDYVPDPNCSYCHGTGRIAWVCPGCGGDGAKHPVTCFQCGGTGTDYVTPGTGGEGWWETCSNCHGTGLTGEYVPGGCDRCKGIGVDETRFVCEHCWE